MQEKTRPTACYDSAKRARQVCGEKAANHRDEQERICVNLWLKPYSGERQEKSQGL